MPRRLVRPFGVAFLFLLGVPLVAWAVPEVRVEGVDSAAWLTVAMSLAGSLIVAGVFKGDTTRQLKVLAPAVAKIEESIASLTKSSGRVETLLEGPGGIMGRMEDAEAELATVDSRITRDGRHAANDLATVKIIEVEDRINERVRKLEDRLDRVHDVVRDRPRRRDE